MSSRGGGGLIMPHVYIYELRIRKYALKGDNYTRACLTDCRNLRFHPHHRRTPGSSKEIIGMRKTRLDGPAMQSSSRVNETQKETVRTTDPHIPHPPKKQYGGCQPEASPMQRHCSQIGEVEKGSRASGTSVSARLPGGPMFESKEAH